MSVLIPDVKIYAAIANKMWAASTHTVCDINHLSCCHSFDNPMTKDDINQIVKTWYKLNLLTYNIRYKEEGGSEVIPFNFNQQPPNTYQFLMWLECVAYNIETSTINRVRPLDKHEMDMMILLNTMIEQAKDAIINSLPEYKTAKWSIY